MAEVIGLGMTHYPSLSALDERMGYIVEAALMDPALPEGLRDPQNWPEPMRREWGNDRGFSAAVNHRAALLEGLREIRRALDEFQPELIVMFGDDQYELFTEALVPAFCVLAWPDERVQPFLNREHANIWGESENAEFILRGHRDAGKYLTRELLSASFDMAYSYGKAENAKFPHAFVNSMLYLDYDREGFEYPIVPVAINCYGSSLISRHGFMVSMEEARTVERDPPSPSPSRCMALGGAVAQIMADSPWRTAIVASSSWSHSFLHDGNHHLHPAVEADKKLFEALMNADYDAWQCVSLSELENNGQQEMLNWFGLVGGMAALGRKPTWGTFVESWVCNSDKCFVIY